MVNETAVAEKPGAVATLRFPAGAPSLADLARWLNEALDAIDDAGTPADLLVEVAGEPGEPADAARLSDWSRWDKALRRLERVPVATVGVLDGAITGPAFHLVLALDFAVATPQTVLLCRDLYRGRLPGMSVYRLAKSVGYGYAKRMLLAGHPVPASEALRTGLVTEVSVDPATVARDLLRRCAPRTCGWPLTRRLLEEGYSLSFEDALGSVLAAQERAIREAIASD
jgi:isomerase DpgB